MLDVFISWSGPLSQEVALYFRELLPEILPNTKPWVSTEDIPKGEEWFQEILKTIGKSPVCIILVTKQNLRSSWIYFEAGGIKFAMMKPKLCAYLLDVDPSQVSSTPIGQMQCTRFNEKDTWRLIRDINRRLETPHDEKLLKVNFEKKWPEVEQKINELIAEHTVDDDDEVATDIIDLSELAKTILWEAAQSDDGVVMTSFTSGGYAVQVNGKNLIDTENPREEADARSAVNELASYGMIEDMEGKGDVFFMRKPGYDMADTLTNSAKAQQAEQETVYTDNDLLALLHGWVGSQSIDRFDQAIKYADIDKEVGIPPGSAKRLLIEAAKKVNLHPHTQGDNVITFKQVLPQSHAPFISPPKRPPY